MLKDLHPCDVAASPGDHGALGGAVGPAWLVRKPALCDRWKGDEGRGHQTLELNSLYVQSKNKLLKSEQRPSSGEFLGQNLSSQK